MVGLRLVFTCFWYQLVLILGCSGWFTTSAYVFIVSLNQQRKMTPMLPPA